MAFKFVFANCLVPLTVEEINEACGITIPSIQTFTSKHVAVNFVPKNTYLNKKGT